MKKNAPSRARSYVGVSWMDRFDIGFHVKFGLMLQLHEFSSGCQYELYDT